MPELPEVETTKTSLKPLMGQQVADVKVFQPKLRWPMPDNLTELIGYDLAGIERRAKYLILNFLLSSKSTLKVNNQNDDNHQTLPAQCQLIIHLGMSGSLQQHPISADKRKHDHLIITFINDKGTRTQLHYHDPRRFGAVLWYEDYSAKLFDHLGPEPLSTAFTTDYLYHLIQRTSADNEQESSTKPNKQRPITRAIKSVIMEQKVVVGVGNIYATESLYLAGIHPATPANELTYEQLITLVKHIKTILKKAIELGGSTLRDFTVASGQTGYFQQTLNVYGKKDEPCPHCATPLDNIKLNGRASIYCPNCQTL
ncbi:bifunctional DNA-formamidopyrimidine glycosylase/DNA-(apurinic or apyrimidinic site) lyase [Psychrobacter jeotgali]|uniref:bifunctional DNA-formamidopyrimidine glycosylase/DNA-(apurinic or apyrimidinic site) lyase n=1 Tax=Psychrobacter jeotgali TaxID=179010 RepID=UPI001919FB8C|nr:bifunctional DNA-formamidopyrimidine glycosylase/DNA-(apurinic or apyrimidinic site) lyase [Psychrobacter jeotgali]